MNERTSKETRALTYDELLLDFVTRLDRHRAGRMACEAVELMFHTAGSSPTRRGHKLQRYFNDVAMYRGHSSAQFSNFGAGLARLHFGLPWGMYGL